MSSTAGDDASATVHAVADAYVDSLVALDPARATLLGLVVDAPDLPDLGPDAVPARADLARRTLARLDGASVQDDDGRLTAALLRERLAAQLDADEHHDDAYAAGAVHSPLFALRTMFPPATATTDPDLVRTRLAQVPAALAGYRATLAVHVAAGRVPGERQLRGALGQLRAVAVADAGGSLFGRALTGAPGRGRGAGGPSDALPEPPRAGRAGADDPVVDTALVDAARAAVDELAAWWETDYLPAAAGRPDGAGPERYARALRLRTGGTVDVGEAAARTWDRLADLRSAQRRLAADAFGGADVAEVLDRLDDPAHALPSPQAAVAWLQDLLDEAVEVVDRDVASLDPRLRRVEAHLAGPGSGAAAHYGRPDLALTRPGRTFLPTLGRTRVPVWPLRSLWYHEGVPGHHVQLGTWLAAAPRIGRFRAVVGYAELLTEGWATYAEQVMAELGHLDDPAARWGYLDGMLLRTARVLTDTGLHLGGTVPHGPDAGRPWSPAVAASLLRTGRRADPVAADAEVTRELSWPGQAPCYELGRSLWADVRDDAARRAGAAFDLRAWHDRVLGLGAVPPAELRDVAVARPSRGGAVSGADA